MHGYGSLTPENFYLSQNQDDINDGSVLLDTTTTHTCAQSSLSPPNATVFGEYPVRI